MQRIFVRILWWSLAVVALGCSGGCLSLKLALGLRTRLQGKPVDSISVSLASQGLGPGQSSRLIIVATSAKGKQLVTVGPGKGTVLFSSFNITGTLVIVGKHGVVSLPEDPRITQGRTPHVHIEAINHPGVFADLDIPVRYDVPFVANFSGTDGTPGRPGADGTAGAGGFEGSTDPKNPSAGGDGNNGGDGGPGGDGDDGGPGDNVHVWLTLVTGDHPMLEARVSGARTVEKLFLIDPHGGSLEVKADGGAAGPGGSGGAGGAGGPGGDGSPKGADGLRGAPGSSGRPGLPGAPGTITITVDPSAKPYLDRLSLSNQSGDGKPGPAPQFTTDSVPPIW